MKRSEANKIIQHTIDVAKQMQFPLPEFAFYTPEDWAAVTEDQIELVENMLGWDITDFGSGEFDKIGLTIFTFRNGNFYNKEKYPKPYAEKLLFVHDGQILPFHYHWSKMEDIINRGGNDCYITVYNGNEAREKLDTDVVVYKDGKREVVPAGTKVRLTPGESITIMQYMYHDFYVPETGGSVLLGEVSMSNDDENDNCFYEPIGRFPAIEEDEAPYRLLCNEYPEAK